MYVTEGRLRLERNLFDILIALMISHRFCHFTMHELKKLHMYSTSKLLTILHLKNLVVAPSSPLASALHPHSTFVTGSSTMAQRYNSSGQVALPEENRFGSTYDENEIERMHAPKKDRCVGCKRYIYRQYVHAIDDCKHPTPGQYS